MGWTECCVSGCVSAGGDGMGFKFVFTLLRLYELVSYKTGRVPFPVLYGLGRLALDCSHLCKSFRVIHLFSDMLYH